MTAAPKIEDVKGTEPGPFGQAALELHGFGLAVIPVGGDDGKVPLVQWASWTRRMGTDAIAKLAAPHRFGGANVGILTGLSRVTVVDCDDLDAVPAMIERCGDTPLKTRTPSGGVHLWYRSAGERCADLRPEGWAVDVKGIGGFVVVPPSIRPSGAHAGKAYGFIEGTWADLPTLPTVIPGSLSTANQDDGQPTRLRAVKEGRRNTMLFRTLLREVSGCDTIEDLQDVAETINDDCLPSLSAAEVAKTVASVWAYERTGNNMVGKEARVYVTRTEATALLAHPDAMGLLIELRFAHGARSAPFAVSPKGMAKANVISGWNHQRYRSALQVLTDRGYLVVRHPGGHGAGDPRLFAFGTPVEGKGTATGPNITIHPSPSPQTRGRPPTAQPARPPARRPL